MSVEQTKIIVVLGMHRSGTSVVTRTLEALGISLGENLMPPAENNNEKGFFEDLAIVSINDDLMRSDGFDWQCLAGGSQTNWANLCESAQGQRAIAYLGEMLEKHPRLGLKDPRMPRLLPFWKAVFRHMQLEPLFLISSRDPLSVAHSLNKRDGLSLEKSQLLWLDHYLPCFRETQGYTRMVVGYDHLIDEPRGQLQRIARFCGLDTPEPMAVDSYIETFLDQGLRHSQVTLHNLQHDPRVDPLARQMFELMDCLARDEQNIDSDQTLALLDDLSTQLEQRAPLDRALAAQDRQLLALKHTLEQQTNQHHEQTTRLEQQRLDLEQQRCELEQQRISLQQQVNDERMRREHLEHNTGELHTQLHNLRTALTMTQASIGEMQRSTSWRVTRPLRTLSHHVQQLTRRTRKLAKRLGRALYYRLPVNQRQRLVLLAFKHLGFAFRGLSHYESWQRQQALEKDYGLSAQSSFHYRTEAETGKPRGMQRQGRYAITTTGTAPYCYLPPSRSRAVDIELNGFAHNPLISIITPVYGVAPQYLEKLIQSVKQQWYVNWELILIEDAGPNPETRSYLQALKDPRIKVRLLERNGGIAAASNMAIELAKGTYAVFLDHDDEITPDALYEVAKAINQYDPDLIYSDEDKIDAHGNYSDPFFKPDWSPDAMMSIMYTCHLCCIKTDLIRSTGGLRSQFDGAQDYDLVLRVSEVAQRIHHIPKVLYHWRVLPSSIASGIEAKPYASDAVRLLKEDALKRRGLSGIVEPVDGMPGQFRINYLPHNEALISIIIPTRDNVGILSQCLESILEHTRYDNYEILLVDNQSADDAALAYYESVKAHARIRLLRYPHPFNYSAINNFAAGQAQGEYLLFLNDDTQVESADWLERMLGFAQQTHAGAVGAKLLFPATRRIQHCGVVNLADGPGHAFYNACASTPLYFGRNLLDWNWLAVTGACLLVHRGKFEAIGGFDEELPVAYNDIDLCIRLHKAGWHNLVCAAAQLLHHESVSRGVDHEDPSKLKRLASERRKLFRKHPDYFMLDPYHNKNLHQNSVDFLVLNY